MPLFIFTKIYSLESNNYSKIYLAIIYRRIYLIGAFIYSDSFIGEARKKSFMSQLVNLAPLFASDMVLLINVFVPTRLDAGDHASSS